jgi:XTP/dITP diphosphohydrolase
VVRVTARLASQNEHKARELARSLPDWQIETLGDVEFPPEVGETYYENALAKARFGRTIAPPSDWVLGEDSGIEAVALGGRPGIHSARWGKPGSSVDRLVVELEGAHDRGARYVCELVCLLPDGRELRGRGTLEGTVAEERRGNEGFGYDPVFIPVGEAQTVAELGDEWKAEHSHRARAAAALLEALKRGGSA